MRQHFKIKSAPRIALAIGFAASTLVWVAVGIEMIPHPMKSLSKERTGITKTFAGNVTAQLTKLNTRQLSQCVDSTVRLNEQVVSIGIKQSSRYIVVSEGHESNWQSEAASPRDRVKLELVTGSRNWGELQIQFADSTPASPFDRYLGFPIGLIASIFAACTLVSWWILSRSFKYLSPSKVVPKRVRSAFDSLTEGLVLISDTKEIAHTNNAFEKIVGLTVEETIGKTLGEFGWSWALESGNNAELPWDRCLALQERITGQILQLKTENGHRQFFVNVSPIQNDKGHCRGAMVSFDDVTEMERQRSELAESNVSLRQSRDEIERQNEQLTFLACYDTLTQCMNRRAFWQKYEAMWEQSAADELNLLMVDIDHFKSINDTYGHSFGDTVLKHVGQTLRDIVGDRGLVCRYGGEEFVVAIPNMKIEQGAAVATEILVAIQNLNIEERKITTSVGVSNRISKAMDCQHLLDQADECLYAAKHAGRNRVIRFDQCDMSALKIENTSQDSKLDDDSNQEIPYSTITRLLSTLSDRCPETARHSIRVADFAVEVGKRMLDPSQIRRLEVAALLHDIGKVGIPTSILNKSGKLSEDEWEVLRTHDRVSSEIISNAFKREDISRIVEVHRETMHRRVAGQSRSANNESAIQISADIITACDAFDSMIRSKAWRSSMSIREALSEIVANTPDQFEPEVVRTLIQCIRDMGLSLGTAAARDNDQNSAPVTKQLMDKENEAEADSHNEADSHDEAMQTLAAATELLTEAQDTIVTQQSKTETVKDTQSADSPKNVRME